MYPKISIVTPSFNQGQYIEQTICSVLNQGYPNLEYIIIDGGSTDNTVEIIKKYESSLAYWVSEPDLGQSDAINKGLKYCTGEIFNWINSDDWYEPNIFFEIANVFRSDYKVTSVSGYENHVYSHGFVQVHQGTQLKPTLEQTIEMCEMTQPSTFHRLDVVKSVDALSNQLHYIMDGELWVKILLKYGTRGFRKIHNPVVNFRIHESSKTFSNNVINNFAIERASILSSLQKCVNLPESLINHYISSKFSNSKTFRLNTEWVFDPIIISKRKLRIYFIKNYLTRQFIIGDRMKIKFGLTLLINDMVFDLFFFKNVLKYLKLSFKNG